MAKCKNLRTGVGLEGDGMTDNEIIKALECHAEESLDTCSLCPLLNIEGCAYEAAEYALNLINRQQAEIERLKKILAEEEEKYKLCAKRVYKVGVKDFAEKLKSTYFIDSERLCCQVDKVFKEMVGDTE